MAVLMATGCVAAKTKAAPKSWPKPVAATEAKQLDGLFGNLSLDAKTGQPTDRGTQLFEFLTGQSHWHRTRENEVAIQTSPDGDVLHLRLYDEQHQEIDSADLRRGVNFEFSKGFVTLHGPLSGLHGGAGNLATGVTQESSRLYVSSTGDLLGKKSDSGAGLLFYFVPYAIIGEGWLLWPKLVPQAPQ